MIKQNPYLEPITQYVPFEKIVTITENRAPTDKSIELYHELVEKANESLIAKIMLNNEIKCDIYVMSAIFGYSVFYAFKINGHEFKIQKEYQGYDFKISSDLYNYVQNQGTELIIELAMNGEISKLLKKEFQDKFNQDINDKTITEFKKQS